MAVKLLITLYRWLKPWNINTETRDKFLSLRTTKTVLAKCQLHEIMLKLCYCLYTATTDRPLQNTETVVEKPLPSVNTELKNSNDKNTLCVDMEMNCVNEHCGHYTTHLQRLWQTTRWKLKSHWYQQRTNNAHPWPRILRNKIENSLVFCIRQRVTRSMMSASAHTYTEMYNQKTTSPVPICWIHTRMHARTHKHIHTHPFNGPFPGLPRWAGTRQVKPIWILLKQETVSGSGISWAICKSATQPTASEHWRHKPVTALHLKTGNCK